MLSNRRIFGKLGCCFACNQFLELNWSVVVGFSQVDADVLGQQVPLDPEAWLAAVCREYLEEIRSLGTAQFGFCVSKQGFSDYRMAWCLRVGQVF